jgi:hypothetical protein
MLSWVSLFSYACLGHYASAWTPFVATILTPYWVGQSPSQGMFPKKTISKSYSEYEVDWRSTFGHGALDISRAHIVSFMGAFVEGVLHPFICNATFYQAIICFSFFMVRTSSTLCNGK